MYFKQVEKLGQRVESKVREREEGRERGEEIERKEEEEEWGIGRLKRKRQEDKEERSSETKVDEIGSAKRKTRKKKGW
jgi:hypothetical protein